MTDLPQCEERHVQRGSVIFRHGDPGDAAFVIARGRVRLTVDVEGRPETLTEIGAGEFFGELSLLSGANRTATAVALEDTTLLGIRRDGFAMMMQDDLEVVFRMMHVLGARLADTDRRMEGLLVRLEQLRLAADALGRLSERGSAGLTTDELASGLGVDAEAVRTALRDLPGVGTGPTWRLDPGALRTTLAALARLADVARPRSGTPPHQGPGGR
jgi:CRP/FNR family transcriptional regulator